MNLVITAMATTLGVEAVGVVTRDHQISMK
jgi:hypothetical protein